jgi:hypothetical protein
LEHEFNVGVLEVDVREEIDAVRAKSSPVRTAAADARQRGSRAGLRLLCAHLGVVQRETVEDNRVETVRLTIHNTRTSSAEWSMTGD